jgi:HAD superfamily hydrolase (TIGR01509 family)
VIFDLDGTLVQTEKLKALSYARAAVELCPFSLEEEVVIEGFRDVVGRSRREVALTLVERFDLKEKASERMGEFGVQEPWQAFVQVRLGIYKKMLSEPSILLENQWPHSVSLLHKARQRGCVVALATMSHCEQANYVLQVLGLTDEFAFIATRDDVERGKPDPEIYTLVSDQLGIPPSQTLVIEDSPSGVQAALSAGMWCIAVASPFTREHLHAGELLPSRWIVDDPDDLAEVVERMMDERGM